MTASVYSSSVLAEKATQVGIEEFLILISKVKQMLSTEKGDFGNLFVTGRLIEVQPVGEAIIVGDLHGDLKSLIHIISESNFLVNVKMNKNVLLIFLGDYGDRGFRSAEVYYIVLKLKEMFPKQVILMRGNHEGPPDLIASPHDLPIHLENRFGKRGSEAYLKLKELFEYFYTAVIIKDRYILLHGGIPSQAKTVDDIAYAHEKHPKERHLEEILWNDPWKDIKGTIASPRGAGRLFGENVTNRFLKMLNVKALIRGHQSSPEGHKFTHGERVLTLFSRTGKPYNNQHGAYLHVDLSQELKTTKQLRKTIHEF